MNIVSGRLPGHASRVPDEFAATLPVSNADAPIRTTLGEARTTMLPRVRLQEGRIELVSASERRYETVRALGQGGMGEVLLVQDNDIERRVAMKRLKEPEQQAALVRFLDEIKTVGHLEHPNIVPIYDAGVDENGACYFIMKYVEGEDLGSVIEKLHAGDSAYHARYPFEARARLFLDVLHAINYAHSRGIVHRDLKPQNIMIGAHGEVRVMDWGVARVMSSGEFQVSTPDSAQVSVSHQDAPAHETLPMRHSLTGHGAMIGTPAYMAPEQAMGDRIDQRADVYALCMLFYELMALQHPFAHKVTASMMIMATLKEEPVMATMVQHSHQLPVPAEYGHFIQKGLQKAPEERYQSVQEMIEELQRVMAGDFHVDCPVTFVKRAGHEVGTFVNRWPRFGMVAVMGALVGLFFVLCLMVYGLIALGRDLA